MSKTDIIGFNFKEAGSGSDFFFNLLAWHGEMQVKGKNYFLWDFRRETPLLEASSVFGQTDSKVVCLPPPRNLSISVNAHWEFITSHIRWHRYSNDHGALFIFDVPVTALVIPYARQYHKERFKFWLTKMEEFQNYVRKHDIDIPPNNIFGCTNLAHRFLPKIFGDEKPREGESLQEVKEFIDQLPQVVEFQVKRGIYMATSEFKPDHVWFKSTIYMRDKEEKQLLDLPHKATCSVAIPKDNLGLISRVVKPSELDKIKRSLVKAVLRGTK